MEHQQDRRHQELPPPPPPAHYPQGQAPSSQPSYQQPRRPSQHQQQYYQQPLSPQEHQPSSSQEYQSSSQSSQQQNQQQQQPSSSQNSHERRKKSRSFSFHSDKNRKKSITSKPDPEQGSAQQKERPIHTKADPTLAINEMEPAVLAAMTHSRLGSLRDIEHKDVEGNPISDPDRSNPTRSRWERPLETIRSFEAAIDGAYNRKSMVRAETDSAVNLNRRSSYQQASKSRYRPDSYYGSRPPSQTPASQTPYALGVAPSARSSVFNGQSGYFDNYTGAYMPGPPRQAPPNHEHFRHYGRDTNVYHLSHKDRSYETVTSAEGSGNSDQIGYQTDPTSSDNSSIERQSPARRGDPANDYGIDFSQPQQYQNLRLGGNQASRRPVPPPQGSIQQGGRPPVPRKEVSSVLTKQSTQQTQDQERPAAPEKRKSWFSRRFSKSN